MPVVVTAIPFRVICGDTLATAAGVASRVSALAIAAAAPCRTQGRKLRLAFVMAIRSFAQVSSS